MQKVTKKHVAAGQQGRAVKVTNVTCKWKTKSTVVVHETEDVYFLGVNAVAISWYARRDWRVVSVEGE